VPKESCSVPAEFAHKTMSNGARIGNAMTYRLRAKLPDLHSPKWVPELEPTLLSLVAAEVVMLTELLVVPGSVNK